VSPSEADVQEFGIFSREDAKTRRREKGAVGFYAADNPKHLPPI
jgi:hypothetical protein